MKKISIIIIIAIGLAVLGCATMYESNNTATNASANKWKKQAPQLFNNAGYIKLEESAPAVNKNQSESMAELIGTITNPFGIRDDILEYIIKTIPNSNESAMRAAIKMMQYNQQMYYGSNNKEDILDFHAKEMLAAWCLIQYLDDPNDLVKSVKYTSALEGQMDNTKARGDYKAKMDREIFAYQVLGTGLSTYEETIACQKGEF